MGAPVQSSLHCSISVVVVVVSAAAAADDTRKRQLALARPNAQDRSDIIELQV